MANIDTEGTWHKAPAVLKIGNLNASEIKEVLFSRVQVAMSGLGASPGTLSASEVVSASATWVGLTSSFCAFAVIPQSVSAPTQQPTAGNFLIQSTVCRPDRIDLYFANAASAALDVSLAAPLDFFVFAINGTPLPSPTVGQLRI